MVFGIHDAPNESEGDLKFKVVDEVFSQKMGVSCSYVARNRRLVRNQSPTPVILYFQDFMEKQSVLWNANKPKGSRIFIHNYYSQYTLCKR